MSSARPSIIKSEARRRGPKKRLSFAPTPEEGETTEVQDENVSQPGSVWVSGDLSCRMTGLGMCYDPKAAHRTRQEPRDSVPMKESHRNNLTSVLHSATPSGTTANVLIVGEKILGEKFKAYLLERHHKRDTIQGLKWRMDLNM
ncbi:hypothetical protein GWK47_020185 [Chionoecetes opilio]|uniref:Uncharacterized protein n=1 Tax=Chionoecetes opilio TaxID=41210 RepID=A0A8J5CHM9_CHIOP|nr:hypothetical protein GWK47_020185 [Chionoecetes opilio]